MAMTNCRECKNEISTTAKSCPKCGATVPKASLLPWLLGIPVVAFFLAVLVTAASTPAYEVEAWKVREVCEKISPMNRSTCRRDYDDAIAWGKAQNLK